MSALIHLLAEHHRKQEKKSIYTKLTKLMGQLSEPFWFVLSLILFMVMGPFSIFAVLIGLHNLASKAKTQKGPEPAHS